MSALLSVVFLLSWMALAHAATITLAWDPPPAGDVPVAGYRLYYGQQSRTYVAQVDVGNVLVATLPGPFQPNIPYYFAATAYDAAAQESGFSNEVSQTFAGEPLPVPGLVLAYGFGENAGSTVADSAGAHPGTLAGSATWGPGRTGSGVVTSPSASAPGYVTTPHATDLSLGAAGTVEAWVKLSALDRWHAIVAKGSGNNDASHNYAIEVSDANMVQCVLGNGSLADVLLASSTPLVIDTWVHVACTWNGTTMMLYLDGGQVASGVQTVTPLANTVAVEWGRFGGGFDALIGTLDDVRIYNRALTAAEVQTDMATPVGLVVPATTITGLTWSMP